MRTKNVQKMIKLTRWLEEVELDAGVLSHLNGNGHIVKHVHPRDYKN